MNEQEWRKKEKRLIINEGGTGSSKTYSLAQLFAVLLMKERKAQITIARKTFPSLRATAMKDFFNILKEWGVYKEENHNKSENTYKYKNNEIDFISILEPTRVRSRRRNYLWLNEANEFAYEDFQQLSMRTDRQIFLDYNPSHQYHWIYDKLQIRKDCVIIPSTYKDNPFLSQEIVKEIEGYKNADENYWRIYGLGLKGFAESLIFTHWEYCDRLPDSFDKIGYGIDFGYNNPSGITKVIEKDKDWYWDEKLYQSHLTNNDLIEKMKKVGINEIDEVYPDMAEPARIEEMRGAGFNMCESDKEVKAGIDFIKSGKLYITKSSVNLIKELRSYSWKTKDGKLLEEPVKENDHLISAGRYAQYSMSKREPLTLEWM